MKSLSHISVLLVPLTSLAAQPRRRPSGTKWSIAPRLSKNPKRRTASGVAKSPGITGVATA